jgi:hypothetical protein
VFATELQHYHATRDFLVRVRPYGPVGQILPLTCRR